MLWLNAFSAVLGAGAQVDTALPLLSDSSAARDQANNLLLPIKLYQAWTWQGGASATRGRWDVPRFRGIGRPYIRPIEAALNPSGAPIFMENFRHPLQFNSGEPIRPLVSDSAGGVRQYVLACWTDRNFNAPAGDMYTIRCTTTGTAVANAWTDMGTLAPDDALMGGRYSIIGMELFAAGGVGGRLIFPGAPQPGAVVQARPGVLVPVANGGQHSRYFRYGRLGVYGEFESFVPPNLEALFTAATATPEVYLDIVQIRTGAQAA
jgi:hypothetical protein